MGCRNGPKPNFLSFTIRLGEGTSILLSSAATKWFQSSLACTMCCTLTSIISSLVIFLFLFTLFLVILLVDKSKQISNWQNTFSLPKRNYTRKWKFFFCDQWIASEQVFSTKWKWKLWKMIMDCAWKFPWPSHWAGHGNFHGGVMEFSNRQRAAVWGREISMGGSWNFPIPQIFFF